jgi:beta-xylosidase
VKEKINGIVISNDGQRAVVRMSDGKLLTVDRNDPLVEDKQTVEQFLKDFCPGEVSPSFERIFVQ